MKCMIVTCVLICGDFNARVGKKSDFIDSVDDLPTRNVIDEVSNDHGVSMFNFCIQTKTCIVNGRVNLLEDGYTLISHHGKAVVDYVLTTITTQECTLLHLTLPHI